MNDLYHIPIRFDPERDGPCKACHQSKIIQILKKHGVEIGRTPLYGHPGNCETMYAAYQENNEEPKISVDVAHHIYKKIKELENLIERYRNDFSKEDDEE